MVKIKAISLAVVCVLVSSCASVKLYPVCFFDTVQPDASAKSKYIESLTATLRKFDKAAESSQDGRWLIARTNVLDHRKLQDIWPSLACIGTVTSGTEVKRSADCVRFISGQLSSGEYKTFDIKLDDIALSDEAPGKPYVICWRSAK
ncbi:hypothetical protein [Pseudomonas sp. AP3_22 TE3818]